jgi:hypothetical protein
MKNEFEEDLVSAVTYFQKRGAYEWLNYDDVARFVSMPLNAVIAELAEPLHNLAYAQRSGWQNDIVELDGLLKLVRDFQDLDESRRGSIVKRLMQKASNYTEVFDGL